METRLLLLLFLCIQHFVLAQTIIEKDWLVQIRQEVISSTFSIPSLGDPNVVVDPFGNSYSCGFASGGGGFRLSIGEEPIPAEGLNYQKFYVSKVDKEGNPDWMIRFSGVHRSSNSYYNIPRVLSRSDGGVFLVSMVRDTIKFGSQVLIDVPSSPSLLLANINLNGQIVDYSILSTNLDQITSAEIAQNGDIILAGRFRDANVFIGERTMLNPVNPSFFLARISPFGVVKWLNSILPKENWLFVGHAQIAELSDGAIVATFSPATYNTRIWNCPESPGVIAMIKVDGASGQLIWQEEILSIEYGQVTSLEERPNGDLYLVGGFGGQLVLNNGESFTALDRNESCGILKSFLVKITTSGAVYDGFISGNNFYVHEILSLPNGNYVIGGLQLKDTEETNTTNTLQRGLVLKLFNQKDQMIHAENITINSIEAILDLKNFDENSILASARFNNNFLEEEFDRSGIFDASLFMARVTLDIEDNATTDTASSDFELFPNPTSGLLNLKLDNAIFGDRPLRIFDTFGREVWALPALGERTQFFIDLSPLPAGIYFIQLGDGDTNVQKVLKR